MKVFKGSSIEAAEGEVDGAFLESTLYVQAKNRQIESLKKECNEMQQFINGNVALFNDMVKLNAKLLRERKDMRMQLDKLLRERKDMRMQLDTLTREDPRAKVQP